MDLAGVENAFLHKYGKRPSLTIMSPGRINIIGEHTDYNDGFVLPAAIDYHIYASISKNQSHKIRLFSIDYQQAYEVPLIDVAECDYGWANLILGVVDQLKDRLEGFDLAFSGNIPKGAGLSSSAAICCAAVYGLNEMFDLGLSKWDMAKLAQNSEHNFAHVNCGIMDQFACLFGITNHALLLNCHTLEYAQHEFDLSGYKFILINSNVPHRLNDSAYNERRIESKRAIYQIIKSDSSIGNYQDLTLMKLQTHKDQLSDIEYRRARHIVSENQRVHDIAIALSNRQFDNAGDLLSESHLSEKNDYEITCVQTDFLVKELNKQESIKGARQVGGGFGGCVLALAYGFEVEKTVDEIGKLYSKKFDLSISNIPVKISGGCHVTRG